MVSILHLMRDCDITDRLLTTQQQLFLDTIFLLVA
jgi:hypothetical protein